MARTEITGLQIKDGTVSLTADVTAILPVANGGTGSNTLTLNNVLLGNGTGALQAVAPGTSGNVLTSNGSTWVSAPAVGEVTLTGTQTLTNKTLPAFSSEQINDLSGNIALSLEPRTNAVNYVHIINAATGSAVQVRGEGTDSNVNLLLRPQGSAGYVAVTDTSAYNVARFNSNGSGSLGNSWVFNAAATGSAINASAVGNTDTNVSINMIPKGSGTLQANGVPVVTTTDIQTLTNKTLTSPTINSATINSLTGVGATDASLSNAAYFIDHTFGRYPAFSPAPKYLWHDLLRFSRAWGTPTFETYSGSAWSGQTLNNAVFSGNEYTGIVVADGTTTTGARWTWNNAAIATSAVRWWMVSLSFVGATIPINAFLVESSADGVTWTTRHTSTVTGQTYPVLLSCSNWSSDSWVRLSITATNAQPISLTSIKALTARHGAQGWGQELEYPYSWDGDKNITALANLKVTSPGTTTNSVATIDGTQTLTNKTITSPKINLIKDTNGNNALQFTATANAANYLTLTNTASGTGAVRLYGEGADTNVTVQIYAKEAGTVELKSNTRGTSFIAKSVASGVNYLQVNSSVAGDSLPIIAAGSDANISVNLVPKGSGIVQANGVDVVTTTGTQSLSNKTISGSSNTLSNIPQSAVTSLTTDLAAKVPTSRTVNGKALSADVTLTQDDVDSGTTNKAYTATEQSKLAGIAAGATANDTDANLKNRANHTGTQTASTISDFSTAADARITAATGTSVQPYVAPGTSGNVLTSNGTSWVSSAPTGGSASGDSANTANTLVKRDASGNFAAGTITAALSGNASTATALQTGRTVQTNLAATTAATFDGSANISPGVTGTLPVANGGTGAATLTANNVLLGNGTSALQAVAPGTSGNVLTSNGTTWVSSAPTGGGSGDVSSNTSTSVDSEVVLFNSTTGKSVKRATGSGIAKLTSGVLSVVTAPTGTIVGTTDTQTLSAKTLTTPTINGYVEGVTTATVGSTYTLAISTATVLTLTLTSNTACTFTMPTATAGTSFTVFLRQPASGTATSATFTGVRWGTGGAPTITAVLGRMDILTFFSDGTNWYGSASQGYQY